MSSPDQKSGPPPWPEINRDNEYVLDDAFLDELIFCANTGDDFARLVLTEVIAKRFEYEHAVSNPKNRVFSDRTVYPRSNNDVVPLEVWGEDSWWLDSRT